MNSIKIIISFEVRLVVIIFILFTSLVMNDLKKFLGLYYVVTQGLISKV